MSRIRSVHPGMASDEVFMSMGFPAQAGWPLLWTECDDHGVFEWKPIVLKARIFPAALIDFATLLAEWESLGCIKKVEIEGKPYGLVRNFCKYQRPKKPSYRYVLPKEHELFVGLSNTTTEPVPNQLPATTEKPPQMKEEGGRGKKKESRAVASATGTTAETFFEEFWAKYPKRSGANPKAPGLKVFRALVASGADPQAIIDGAKRCAEKERGKVGTEFIPQAIKWLRDRRWEDYNRDAAYVQQCEKNASARFFAKQETPQWDAWQNHLKRTTGKGSPCVNFGWHFDTEWPPGWFAEAAE